ncbi:MAG: hypothetical protein CL912_28715 [Deltaproteobacteria bacterium]|nr:hypothetical protein [Deltaproteobacteria bacterium]
MQETRESNDRYVCAMNGEPGDEAIQKCVIWQKKTSISSKASYSVLATKQTNSFGLRGKADGLRLATAARQA